MNDLPTLNSVAQNAHFWQVEMHRALCEMFRHSFKLDDPKPFNDAQARFDLARERCAKEMLRLKE